MIIVIKNMLGDRYEYSDYIQCILDVDIDKTGEQLKEEHLDYLIKIMEENKIVTYPNQPWVKPKTNKKLHEKLMNEHCFLNWLQKTYFYKDIGKFVEIYNL